MEIHGYNLITEFTTNNSGTSRWALAKKDDFSFFVKEFLSPVYPLNSSLFSADDFKNRKEYCDAFVRRKVLLYGELQKCNNPDIVCVLDFFRHNTKYYVVTEQVENLENSDNYHSIKILLQSCLKIAEIISELHKHGIVHGDIKSSNLLYSTIGTDIHPKLIDFDNSFFVGEYYDFKSLEGDPVFLAPEMFRAMRGERISLGTEIDIFGLGVLFWYILFKKNPEYIGMSSGYAFEGALSNKELYFPSGTDKNLIKLLRGMLSSKSDKRIEIREVIALLKKIEKTYK